MLCGLIFRFISNQVKTKILCSGRGFHESLLLKRRQYFSLDNERFEHISRNKKYTHMIKTIDICYNHYANTKYSSIQHTDKQSVSAFTLENN